LQAARRIIAPPSKQDLGLFRDDLGTPVQTIRRLAVDQHVIEHRWHFEWRRCVWVTNSGDEVGVHRFDVDVGDGFSSLSGEELIYWSGDW
jgi:hypothetical protein